MVEKNEYYAECPISCPGVHDTEKSALRGADFPVQGRDGTSLPDAMQFYRKSFWANWVR